jgi:catechol 2,3-dioxygenase-like lactoylglutathione lyase family enzyme
VPRIGFASFAVVDDAKAESFYVDQMGMKEQSRPPGADGTTEILLVFPDAPDSATLVLRYDANRKTPYEHGDAFSRIGFTVSDIAGLVMRLRSAGSTIIAGPTAATGLTWAQVKDPDGYTIELLELSSPSRSALPRIGFVSFAVMDVMRAENFYVQQLGMREQSRQPSGSSTEIVLSFSGAANSATLVLMYSANRTTPYQAGDAFNRFGIAVSDLDGLLMRLGTASISILKPKTAVGTNGFTYAQVKDPDGYTTELVEYKP